MSEYQLTPEQVLSTYNKSYDGVELSELTQCALVSMVSPLGEEQVVEQQIQDTYGMTMPAVGQWCSSDLNHTRLLKLQRDLCFVQFDYSGDQAVKILSETISSAYLSDQSDGWVMLKLSGEKSHDVLARICPIDLHPTVFTPGCVARTQMEHINAIIICDAVNEYTLMAARSYAQSFLHSLEVSIKNLS